MEFGCVCFFFYPCEILVLDQGSGSESMSLALGAWSFNHWTINALNTTSGVRRLGLKLKFSNLLAL